MIHKRHYLLTEDFGRKIMEYSSHNNDFIFLDKLHETDMQRMIKKALPTLEAKVRKNDVMFAFWKNANKKLKDDLILSYCYHEYEKNVKVLNVETENWFNIAYFKNFYNSILKERQLIWKKPLIGLAAYRNTLGKHYLNLRFENIHLAVDKIGKKYIYQIHWDIKYPQTAKKILAHFFHDDLIG